MKKIYVALSALVLPCLAASADAIQVPYHSNFTEGKAVSPDWTVVDADNNGKELGSGEEANKWVYPIQSNITKFFSDGTHEPGLILYTRQQANNDRLVSPAIHLEAGKEYAIRFEVTSEYSKANGWTGELYLAAADDAEANTNVQSVATFTSAFKSPNANREWVSSASMVTVSETGDYRIALSITWGDYRYGERMAVTNFSVNENIFIPAAPSDFAASAGTIDDPRAMSVTLTWTNPTQDINGAPFAEGKTLEKVVIYRDGEETPLVEITDGSTTWTDTEETGLTGGNHTYEIEAVVSGETSSRVNAESGFVGPIVFDVPCDISLADQADFDLMWSSDTDSWRWTASDKGAMVQQSSTPGWLYSPELNFSRPGRYELTLKAGTTTTDGGIMQVAIASEATPDAMAEGMIEPALSISQTDRGAGVDTDIVTIDIETPGIYHLGFRMSAESTSQFNCINAISIEAVPAELYLLCTLNEYMQDYMYRFYTMDGDTYNMYTDLLGGGFRIESGMGSFPSYSFSTATPITVGEEVTLTDGVAENATIDMQGNDYLSGVNITFTLSTGKILVEGTLAKIGIPEAVYMVGDVNGKQGSTSQPTELVKEGNIFALETVQIDDSGDGFGYFTLEVTTADTPEDLQWFHRYGSPAEGTLLATGITSDVKAYIGGISSAECIPFKAAPGEYAISFDAEARTVTLNIPSGVDEILDADNAGDAEYFDMQGIRVDNPVSGGVYIVRRGSEINKVIVR